MVGKKSRKKLIVGWDKTDTQNHALIDYNVKIIYFNVLKKFPSCTSTVGDKTNAQNHVLQDNNVGKKIQESIDSWLGQNRRSKLSTH